MLENRELKTSESKRKANAKYDATHTKQFHLKFNLKTDTDVISRLQSAANIQAYVRRLIRQDIAEEEKQKTVKAE